MAQTPYFTNSTPIAQMDTRLAGSIGDRLGAGIQQAAQGFAAGIERKRAQEAKKAEDEQAAMLIKKMGPQLGMGDLSDEDIKAGIKGMGGGSEVLKLAAQIQQAQQQQASMARQAQIDKEAEEERKAMRAALMRQGFGGQAADGGPGITAGDVLGTYAAQGGADPRGVSALIAANRAATPQQGGPQLVELAPGVRGVWDGNNFQQIRGQAAGSPLEAPEVRDVGGRKFFRGSGDADWKPLNEASAARANIMEQVNESDRLAEAQRLQRELAEAQAAIAAGRGNEKKGGVMGFGGRTHREIAMSAAIQLESLAAGAAPAAPTGGQGEAVKQQILEEYRAGKISKEEALRRAKEAGIE